ncbi:MAG TPA: TM2 domain-containing protein [Bacilli bacterium]|nr:TM2 domain-containing protein [Bacilli bacterium]
MDKSFVSLYLMTKGKYFEPYQVNFVRKSLIDLEDDNRITISSINLRDPLIVLLLSIFLGGLGIDMFYIGEKTRGLRKLILGVVSFVIFLVAIALVNVNMNPYGGINSPGLRVLIGILMVVASITILVQMVFVIIDWFKCSELTKKKNYLLFTQALNACKKGGDK